MRRFEIVPTDEKQMEDAVTARQQIEKTAIAIVSICPEGRCKEIALTKLEEALFWANKAICGND